MSREMGKKTVYIYVGRPVTEQERQDITVRVLGAVPNATEVVVYPLPGATAPAVPGNSTPRPNTTATGAPAQPAQQANPNSQPRSNGPGL